MLQRAITEIGQRLMQCSEVCVGVVHDAAAGILPGCPILERAESNERGCLVAGINPRRSKASERAYYRQRGPSYEVVTMYWHQYGGRIPYYKSLRQFVDGVGLTGPIIWSDLAKCENCSEVKRSIPLQTLRTCASRFLRKELEVTPEGWPVFGVGREAYRALAYLEPTRTVIGIPHPTGSPGQFREFFVNGRPGHGYLRNSVAEAVFEALSSVTPVTLWVS